MRVRASQIGRGADQRDEQVDIVVVVLALKHCGNAFEARAGRWEELRWSLERIRHRFGTGRLWRAAHERPTAALPEQQSRLVDIGQ